jgi:hypothetical protein
VNLAETFLLATLRGRRRCQRRLQEGSAIPPWLRLAWFKSIRHTDRTRRARSARGGGDSSLLAQTGASENAYDEERTRTHPPVEAKEIYDPEAGRLELTHQPDSGTPLKNGDEGERMIALNAKVCRVIEDWIEQNRHSVEDD